MSAMRDVLVSRLAVCPANTFHAAGLELRIGAKRLARLHASFPVTHSVKYDATGVAVDVAVIIPHV